MKNNGSVGNAEMISYAIGETAFGRLLIAWSERGLCALRRLNGSGAADALEDLRRELRGADLVEDSPEGGKWFERIKQVLAGRLEAGRLPLDLRGTPFQ